MFEPETPECKLYPTDSKEEIGKEEWIAEKSNHTEHESGPDCPI